MRSKIFAPGCAAGGVLLCLSGTSIAGFSTVSHEIVVDPSAQEVAFTLHFSEPPEFQTVDEHGDALSAFQIFIDPSPSAEGFNYDDVTTLIRGVNVQPNNMLAVWDFSGVEGFRELRGKVPIEITDRWVSFVASFDTLNDDDGNFDYRLESYSHGEMTALNDGTTNVVPLPPAMWSGMTLLTAVGAVQLRRRNRD
jgi:hypothetical protein